MPKRQEVSALKQICMSYINENILSYSTEVLQNLPSGLAEDLINSYDKKFHYGMKVSNTHSYSNRNRLIGPNVRHLKLSLPNKRILKDTLPGVLKVGENLVYLSVGCNSELPDQDLLELVQSIPNIVKLNIFNEDSGNDDILAAIGDNCPKLEFLSFLSVRITDDGIRRLIQSKSGGCNIQRLMVGSPDYEMTSEGYRMKGYEDFKVTSEGCLLALENLKQLKVLQYTKVIGALIKLFEQLNGLTHPTFELIKLPIIIMNSIPPGFLHFLTECCPNVTHLQILTGLHSDYHLNELRNCRACSFTLSVWWIDPGMCLSEINSNITRLYLHDTFVDLVFIGCTCPNLNKMILSRVQYLPLVGYAFPPDQISKSFKKLTKLDLISSENRSIPLQQLEFLLENCVNLDYLTFQNNNFINDDTITSILHQMNLLKHLTHLQFECCNKISKVSILKIIDIENELQELVIGNCQKITQRDLAAIKCHVKNNNYCIDLNRCVCADSQKNKLLLFLILIFLTGCLSGCLIIQMKNLTSKSRNE